MGITFAYVATSAFVLQSMNGLSPMQYSVDFAANAGGMTLATLVAARYADRVPGAGVRQGRPGRHRRRRGLLLVGALWFVDAAGRSRWSGSSS